MAAASLIQFRRRGASFQPATPIPRPVRSGEPRISTEGHGSNPIYKRSISSQSAKDSRAATGDENHESDESYESCKEEAVGRVPSPASIRLIRVIRGSPPSVATGPRWVNPCSFVSSVARWRVINSGPFPIALPEVGHPLFWNWPKHAMNPSKNPNSSRLLEKGVCGGHFLGKCYKMKPDKGLGWENWRMYDRREVVRAGS